MALSALAVALGLTFPILAFLLLAAGILFLLGAAQHPQVMLRVLLEIFGSDAIIAQLRIPRQLVILVDDLLGRAAHLAFGA